MRATKPTGPRASSRKYDLLAALGAWALGAGGTRERTALRLIALITARYNWRSDELSMARREIARLWSVDERTVKREMGRLKELGFLRVKRPGARGRATVYGLGLERLTEETRPAWPALGPDFMERLGAVPEDEAPQGNVVPLRPGAPTMQAGAPEVWTRMRETLAARNPARYAAWFQPLEARETAEGLILTAPTRFHADYVETHLAGDLAAAAMEAGIAPGAVRIAR